MYKTKILTLVIAMLTLVSCQNNEIDISIIYTPVRDKKSQIKVGNLAIYLYLYS